MQQTQYGRAAVVPVLAAALTLFLSGCGGTPKQLEAVSAGSEIPDAVPRVEPKARYGNMASYVVYGKTYYPEVSSRGYRERGIASWYGPKFHGRKTSSGERYDMHRMTAAHKTLPLPSYTLVRNLENGRSAIVKVNDRGPFIGDRIIDLSYAAAKKLGVDKKGLARVEVVSIDPRDHGGKVPKLWRAAGQERSRTGSSSWKSPTTYRERPGGLVEQSRHGRPERAEQPGTPVPDSSANPSSTSVPAPAPVSAPTIASGEGSSLFLQVGAFGTRDNAEQLRRRLRSLLQDRVQIHEVAHGPASATTDLYKVRIGPIASRTRADALTRRLAALGIYRPLVIEN